MARQAKSPALPLYGKDAWSDERFLLLDWDAQGLFWRLAFLQWMEGDIPADIDAVIDIVGKARQTRRLWPIVSALFVVVPGVDGRLYNLTTHGHRERMLEERKRKQNGADITNSARAKGGAQRTGVGALSVPDEVRLATGNGGAERVATRAANAKAIGSSPNPEIENSEIEKTLTPQQTAVKCVLDRLEESTNGFLLPDGGRIAKWIALYGIDVILSAISDEGVKGNLDGRNPSYLQQCIESAARRGTATRTSVSRPRSAATTSAGQGAEPPRKPERARFPIRTGAELLAERKVHQVPPAADGGSSDPVS